MHEARTDHPSPFASQVLWRRTNQLMYEDDAAAPEGGSRARRDLLAELLQASHLRPRLAPGLVDTFRRKLQRVFPGYAPRTAAELHDLVEERVLLSPAAWRELQEAVARDTGRPAAELVTELEGRLLGVRWSGAPEGVVVAVQALPRVLRALGLAPGDVELRAPDLASPAPETALAALGALLDREPDGGETMEALLADLLRSHGPVAVDALAATLGFDDERLLPALESLRDAGDVILDQLTAGTDGVEVCDASNLERLLRLQRAAARPQIEPLPLAALPAFLAEWQGVASTPPGVDGLRQALERLWGYPAPAAAWEEEILPARLEGYQPAWLDALFAETELSWAGCGNERLVLLLPADRELVLPATDEPELAAALEEMHRLFPHAAGRFTLAELAAHSGLGSAELTRVLWRLAWAGLVGNDGFAAVRRGIESDFKPATPERADPGGPPRRRLRFAQWQGTRPFAGSWFPTPPPPAEDDPLAEEELLRERARLVLQRYGVVFRELLARELPDLQWSRLARTLRLMELGGEIVGGQLFEGIPGLQLATPMAVRRLERGIVGRPRRRPRRARPGLAVRARARRPAGAAPPGGRQPDRVARRAPGPDRRAPRRGADRPRRSRPPPAGGLPGRPQAPPRAPGAAAAGDRRRDRQRRAGRGEPLPPRPRRPLPGRHRRAGPAPPAEVLSPTTHRRQLPALPCPGLEPGPGLGPGPGPGPRREARPENQREIRSCSRLLSFPLASTPGPGPGPGLGPGPGRDTSVPCPLSPVPSFPVLAW